MVVRRRAPPHAPRGAGAHCCALLLFLCASSSTFNGPSFFSPILVVAAARSAQAPSAVHLTDDGFDAALGRVPDDEHALMEFYMPWCPACQNLAPEYERVSAFYNKGVNMDATTEGPRPVPHVTAFSVDCQANGQLCDAFNVRSYPHVLFGTAARFKTRAAADVADGLEALTPFAPRTAERMVQMVGERTGAAATHVLISTPPAQINVHGGGGKGGGASGADDKPTATTPTYSPSSSSKPTATTPTYSPSSSSSTEAAAAAGPDAADLEDIEHATVLAFEQMTSPALLVPESRAAFLEFAQLLAVAHPLRACKRGAQELVKTFAAVWPQRERGGGGGTGDIAPVRRRLADFRICGDGHDKTPLTWRACRGSVEGTRGYTCGLWLLFHSLAARSAYPTSGDGGLRWLQAVSRWVTFFFPCEDCRKHFLAMVDEAKGVMKKRDGMLWSWRAHNRVNARLKEQEARGEGGGSGDPAFPKVQWPARDACPRCYEGNYSYKGGGDGAEAAAEWNEDEVFKYLVGYFHGLGAPRSRPSGAATPGVAAPEGESLSGYWKVTSRWENGGGDGGGGGGWGVASSPVFIGAAVAAVPLLAVVALMGVGSTEGKTFNGYWTRHINKTRAAFRRRSGGHGSRAGSPLRSGGGDGGECHSYSRFEL